ncbi:MAG: hypothetical protein MMC23_001766 [Stictis urceolatum]|nr:hypothetical protein [Stictis urceolata]
MKALRGFMIDRYIVTPDENHSCYQPQLPNTEGHRLQRAFLRFEIIRKLFGAQCCDGSWFLRSQKHSADSYFRKFTSQEQAEICWVFTWLRTRVEGVFDKVQDDVVKDITNRAHNDNIQLEPLRERLFRRDGIQVDDWDVYAFTMLNAPSHEGEANPITSFGLSFIKYLSGLDIKQQYAILNTFSWTRPKVKFGDYLESMIDLGTDPPSQGSFSPYTYPDEGPYASDSDESDVDESFMIKCSLPRDQFANTNGSVYAWLHDCHARIRDGRPGVSIEIQHLGIISRDEERLRDTGLLAHSRRGLERSTYATTDAKINAMDRLKVAGVRPEVLEGTIPRSLDAKEIGELIRAVEY